MKHILIIVIATFSLLNCKAQSPILPLSDWTDEQTNAYYKDLNNELNAFEGTWLYTNGNTSLKIVLVKKTMYFNGNYYEDLIVGEYQYIEDGVEKINTLASLNLNLGFSHKISGSSILNTCFFLPTDDCVEGEIRLNVSLIDAITPHWANVLLQKRVVNGQDALKAFIVFNYSGNDYPDVLPSPTLPWQDVYILIKQ